MPNNDDPPCNGSDAVAAIFGTGTVTIKCFPLPGSSGTGASTTTQATSSGSSTPPTNPPFVTTETNVQSQVAEYEAAVKESIQKNDTGRIPELRIMSEKIQHTLNKMIENITYLKKETPAIKSERDTLLETLRRIQQDYSAMVSNTDDLETLRRIRQQENGEARRLLIIYLLAFLFVCAMLLVYILFTGRKPAMSQTTVATPTMSPALT